MHKALVRFTRDTLVKDRLSGEEILHHRGDVAYMWQSRYDRERWRSEPTWELCYTVPAAAVAIIRLWFVDGSDA